MRKTAICVALIAGAAFGQGKTAFEVATIKPAPPIDPAKFVAAMQSGGPMPVGPRVGAHRAEYLYMSLKSLIVYAYQVKPYQVAGPDWLEQQRFDIIGTYPEGATKADAARMLQSLLEERFHVKVHRSTEERPVLALVAGKGGPKLKRSAEKPAPIDDNAPLQPGERKVDGPEGKPMIIRTDSTNGAAVVNMGEQGKMTYRFDRAATPPLMHIEFSMVTMEGLASMMTQILTQVGGRGMRQIVDMTQVEGNYEAQLDLSVEDMVALARRAGVELPPSAPAAGGTQGTSVPVASDPGAGMSVNEAVRSMGLKLESRKAPVELLVVDHAEKAPTAN